MPLKLNPQQPKGLRPHEPLRTVEEIAESFGVTTGSLEAYMRRTDAPKAVFLPTGSKRFTRALKYYSPSEMRKWWKTIQEAKCPPQS